ncbi:MAG: Unknown protein [uncultured Sulfurovum sp.]|uniref:Lipoprotein n=1 Tax=uncultured Sulfurovum sp. TaxID=269237 RepID=A0A6S6T3Y2_9BACT|nr:MAG: Unknown protein [uncultured Sulfurovum sp.]
MKKLIFSALLGLGMIAFTGCTTGNDAEAGAKCSTSKKCAASKCATTKKCAASKCAAKKLEDATKKCAASGKCAAGKCGTSK